MVTKIFNSDFNWIVPDTNSDIIIRCYGGRGVDGEDTGNAFGGGRSSSGSNGAFVEGTLNTSPGEVLYIRIGGSGSGGSTKTHTDVNDSDEYIQATGGRGGNAADVRVGGNGLNDIVISAGGGGGGAATDHYGGGSEYATNSGAGGGEGQDGEGQDVDIYTNLGSANGGESGGYFGGSGSSTARSEYDDDGNNEYGVASAGGGGGGIFGGQGGGAVDSGDDYHGAFVNIAAGGGGGGDGSTAGVHSTTVDIGGHSGSAKVEIDFDPFPNPPLNLNAIANHQAPNIELTWDVHDSITEGFNISRGTDPNFEHNVDNRIVRITDENARSYTDTNTERGVEYYYKMSSWTNTYSESSTAEGPAQATAGEVFKINEDGTFTQYPVRYWDTSEWDYASELRIFTSGGYSTSGYGEEGYEDDDGGWEAQ